MISSPSGVTTNDSGGPIVEYNMLLASSIASCSQLATATTTFCWSGKRPNYLLVIHSSKNLIEKLKTKKKIQKVISDLKPGLMNRKYTLSFKKMPFGTCCNIGKHFVDFQLTVSMLTTLYSLV